MTEPFTVAVIQMKMSTQRDENMEKACNMLKEAAEKGAQLACLPELFLGHYFCQTEDHTVFDQAEAIPGPSTSELGAIAKETGMVIIGSLFERRTAGIYHNTAAILDADGSHIGTYRKMHIPDDPLFYEKFYFTPGDLGFQSHKTKFAEVGTLICWDQWYPEGARLTAMQGAEILFYPTAIGSHPAEKAEWESATLGAWQTIQRSHAIANGLYVAVANRVGHEPTPGGKGDGLDFWGNSFIADPYGRIIAQASRDKEEILIAQCDPKLIEHTRRNWPFLRDRRIDAYGDITKRFSK